MDCMKIGIGDGATCKENGIDASFLTASRAIERLQQGTFLNGGTRAIDGKCS